jgi:hypothetical protein
LRQDEGIERSRKEEGDFMKRLMTALLGLSLMFGGVAVFAQDKPADTTTTKPKKMKKAKVKKTKVKKEKAGTETSSPAGTPAK